MGRDSDPVENSTKHCSCYSTSVRKFSQIVPVSSPTRPAVAGLDSPLVYQPIGKGKKVDFTHDSDCIWKRDIAKTIDVDK